MMVWRAFAGAASAAALTVTGWLLGPSAQAAPAPQLTGTQLASALLPASYFGSGYKVSKVDMFNSGPSLEHAKARYNLATYSCQKYLADDLPLSGFGETASALAVAVNRGARKAYEENVFQFADTGQAAVFYQRYYAFVGRCRTITSTAGQLTTQSLKKTRLGRLPAFSALQTVTQTGNPSTINDTTVTVAGTDVYLVDAFGQKAPPAKPAVPATLLRVIARVQAVR